MHTGAFYSANALKKLVMAVFRYPAAAVLWFLVFPLSIISDVFFFFFFVLLLVFNAAQPPKHFFS